MKVLIENMGGYIMNMLNEKLAERNAKLTKCSLFCKLDYQDQEDYKNIFKSNVEILSKSIECSLEKQNNSKNKILVKYNDLDNNAIIPQAYSKLTDGEYIGEVIINIGLLIHLYEMFFDLNYKTFVPDGKNIDNIKKMMFSTSVNIILCHEVAHIYYRHELLKRELLTKYGSDSIKYKLDIQTLEYDADAFAITKMYEFITKLQEHSTPAQSKLYYQIFIYSLHALIYLFRQTDDFDYVTEHPAFFIREKAMLKVVNNLFNNHESKAYIDFAEKEFNRQFEINEEILNSYFEKMESFTIQLTNIEKNYDSLKYDIKRFSRLPVEGIDYPDYRNLFSKHL